MVDSIVAQSGHVRNGQPDADPIHDVITTREAAAKLGITPRAVTDLLRRGRLVGCRLSKDWAVSCRSVLRYKAAREARQQTREA